MFDKDCFGEDTVCGFLNEESRVEDGPVAMPLGDYLGRVFRSSITFISESKVRYAINSSGTLERFSKDGLVKESYHPSDWAIVFKRSFVEVMESVKRGEVRETAVLEKLNLDGRILGDSDVLHTLCNKRGCLLTVVFMDGSTVKSSGPLVGYKR